MSSVNTFHDPCTELNELRERIAQLEAQVANVQQQLTLYHALFEQLPVPIVVFDTQGKALAINKQNQQLIGVPASAIVGIHTIYDDPQAREMGYLDCFEQAVAGAVVTMPPTAYDTAKANLSDRVDDRQIWSQTTYFPVYDNQSTLVAVGEMNLDVTERMRAAQEEQRLASALRDRDQRFRALFSGTTIGVAFVTTEAQVLDPNPALQAMLGCNESELHGRSILELAHPDDRSAGREAFSALIHGTQASYQIEQRYVRNDGSLMRGRLTCALVRDASGDAAFAIGMIEDITAQREAESAQQASELLLRSILDQLPSAIYVKDRNSRYLLTNRAFQAIVGTPGDHLHEVSDRALFSSGMAARFIASDHSVFTNGTAIEQEDEILVAGVQRTFLTTKFPIYDANGVCQAICGISTDITTRKQAEAERLAFERSLFETQKLESLGILTGGIAHDFNNLLAGILANAGLALEDLPLDTPARYSIEQVTMAAQRAADLTRQMLLYAGRGQLIKEQMSVNEVVDDMLTLLRTSLPKHVRMVLDLADNLGDIYADATQIRQVIMNLVLNAAEAIEGEQGVVTVRTEALLLDERTKGRLAAAAELPPGSYVVLTVADTGVGMDEATAARVFEPFFTTKFVGRGLGLASVRGIVQGHGGAIALESAYGVGTTFRVFLPAATEAEPQRISEKVVAPPAQPGTILIIDDEDAVRDIARRVLERDGWNVLSSADGATGIQIFDTFGPSITCVLLDMTMPHQSGRETLREIRKRNAYVPIVIMSGYTETDANDEFSGEQLAGFLQKPFTPDSLRLILAQASRGVA